MKIEVGETSRGFRLATFTDAYGVECSAQESSIMAEEGHLWLGASDIGLKELIHGEGWRPVDLSGREISANNRMHLSQSQVAALLPLLQRFAETGRLEVDPEEGA